MRHMWITLVTLLAFTAPAYAVDWSGYIDTSPRSSVTASKQAPAKRATRANRGSKKLAVAKSRRKVKARAKAKSRRK